MVFKTGGVGERECISVFKFSMLNYLQVVHRYCDHWMQERARSCPDDAGEL